MNFETSSDTGVSTITMSATFRLMLTMNAMVTKTVITPVKNWLKPIRRPSANVSVSAITPCIIGGVGTVFGPIIGAAIIEPISEITNAALSNYVGMNMVVYGLILVVVIMVMPKGVIGLVQELKVKLTKNKVTEV